LIFQNKYYMNTGAKVLILLFLCPWVKGFSQQLSHQVLVPAAGLVSNSKINYSQTIGETAVEIISSGFILTQGFQQPGMLNKDNPQPLGTGVDVYPNPARDHLFVKLFGQDPRNFRIEIITIAGTIMSTSTIDFITTYNYEMRIDINSLTLGIYFVRVSSDDSKINRVFKIEKM
jgi:hypothetical protein